MNDAVIYLIVILIASTFAIFNIFTISVILIDKKLKKITTNLPILSFLFASALQGIIAAPIYVYKKLEHREHLSPWICDVYRAPYFFCGHIMKMSLLLVSIDRLLAVQYPFKHEKYISIKKMTALICILWFVTLVIDILPFFLDNNSTEHCHYVPTRTWGLCVIVLYNLIPFFCILVNYILIWIIAAKFAFKDKEFHNKKVILNENENIVPDKQTDYGSVKKSKSLSNIRFALEMKATKTTLALLAVYVVCWGPLGVFYMTDHFCYNCLSNRDDLKNTRAAIKLLCFTSSLLAPLVYCWLNHQFRKAAGKMLKKYCYCGMKKKPVRAVHGSCTETYPLVKKISLSLISIRTKK